MNRWRIRGAGWLAVALMLAIQTTSAAGRLPGFQASPWFDEQVREERVTPAVRVLVNAPAAEHYDPELPTQLNLYALPNGNTIEQTMGCRMREGLDWHYDIQHIAAQTRKLRDITPDRNIVLACAEAEGLSWPAWRRKQADDPRAIPAIVDRVKALLPAGPIEVVLAAHSGGGSFLWGFFNGHDAIPGDVVRIVFLDANYSFSEEDQHGTKLLDWLEGDTSRRLIVLAYDDREITYQGKRVVGPTGGTLRASHRMIERFQRDVEMETSIMGPFDKYEGLDGRIQLLVHKNPQNKILHTALVGDMNGFLYALTLGTSQQAKWGTLGGPRAYSDWIQPPPGPAAETSQSSQAGSEPADFTATIPPRPPQAVGGGQFIAQIAPLDPPAREAAIVDAILAGNIPSHLRSLRTVRARVKDADGAEHSIAYRVMPDYLAVGEDDDFVRIPMTPMSAQAIADRFGSTLPTRRMVDQIYQQADVKLAPRPLTENRESPATFAQHNEIIRQQRQAKRQGLLVAGIKKDVVLTNRLAERPRRVAIFGWHRLDGTPIQPLTIVHVNTYVDYSHGIRLVDRQMEVDGRAMAFEAIAQDEVLWPLVSDEGVLTKLSY